MRCPNCSVKIREGAASHRDCGWKTDNSARSVSARRRGEFDSLPPCYKCGGVGIMPGPVVRVKQSAMLKRKGRVQPSNEETHGISACPCPRGQWMRANAEIFAPAEQQSAA